MSTKTKTEITRAEYLQLTGLLGHQVVLEEQVAAWPTPTEQDSANTAGASQFNRNTPPLNVACHLIHHDQPTSTDGAKSSKSTRVLNPRFVEWLMGWPIGWTDCACVETVSSQIQPPSRGSFLATNSGAETS